MNIQSDHSRHSASDSLHGHRHRGAYVALVLAGSYTELSADGAWSVGPGDVVVHPPFHLHANSFQGETTVLNLRVPDAICWEAGLEAYAVLRPDRFDDLLRKGTDADALQETLSRADRVAPAPPGNWVDSMAQDLTANSSVRIADLARRYSVSTEHACRRFRQRYLMTPSTIRSERRFRHALQLLRSSQHSLGDIAHMAGYADQPHFSRSCLQITGLSPGRLRGTLC